MLSFGFRHDMMMVETKMKSKVLFHSYVNFMFQNITTYLIKNSKLGILVQNVLSTVLVKQITNASEFLSI